MVVTIRKDKVTIFLISQIIISHFPIEQRTGSSWCLEGRLEEQQVIVSELNIY
jgi:hypothetical protein